MAGAFRTIDHQTIVEWVQARGGQPAHVKRPGALSDPRTLRIDFPGFSSEERLEPLDWDSWFDAFETLQLAFLYVDKGPRGELIRFTKLVRRRSHDELPDAMAHQHGSRRTGRTSLIDLSNADEEELEIFWGAGPATARRILAYRREAANMISADVIKIEDSAGPTLEDSYKQMHAG